MKFTKMSLVAALLIGSSAFAIENTKVSGEAKLAYSTQDSVDSLFDKDASSGQVALDLGITTDLTENISAGVSTQAISTLGLENNLVSGVSAGQSTQTQWWVSEAWMAASAGKTTLKVGRQSLDTPLTFTETWNIASNTFDAAVVINQDIPDTTIVAAWVGKSNGTGGGNVVNSPVHSFDDDNNATTPNVEVQQDAYGTFAVEGAYAFAIVNNSWKPLTVQAWYYNVLNAANAVWLQADLNIEGIIVGAQYANLGVKGVLSNGNDSSAYAGKLGYTNADMGLTVSAAYSQTDKKGTLDVSNVATGHSKGSQSKLYTEAWWNYGYVGAADMTAINLTAEYAIKEVVDLGLYYTTVDAGSSTNFNPTSNHADMDEITLTASKSFGPLDTSLVYIYAKQDGFNNDDAYNTVQAYLTLNF